MNTFLNRALGIGQLLADYPANPMGSFVWCAQYQSGYCVEDCSPNVNVQNIIPAVKGKVNPEIN
jgi:hypothetical protein